MQHTAQNKFQDLSAGAGSRVSIFSLPIQLILQLIGILIIILIILIG